MSQISQSSWYNHIIYYKRKKNYTQHLKPREWHHTANIKSNAGGELGEPGSAPATQLSFCWTISIDICFSFWGRHSYYFWSFNLFYNPFILPVNRKEMQSKLKNGLAYQTKGWHVRESVQLVSTSWKLNNTSHIATGSRPRASWNSSVLSTRTAHLPLVNIYFRMQQFTSLRLPNSLILQFYREEYL